MKLLVLIILIVAVVLGFKTYRTLSGSEAPLVPAELYKILSVEDWEASKFLPRIKRGTMDQDFIHLATREQLRGVRDKFWAEAKTYVVLSLSPSALSGRLVLESNPGGSSKYYHLYDGEIPHGAVSAVKTVQR